LRPSKLVRDFIQNNDFRARKIAIFGSSTTGLGIETMGMERLLKRRGAIITGKFHCAGNFFFIRQGRPAEKDLGKARQFARSVKNAELNAIPINKEHQELGLASKSPGIWSMSGFWQFNSPPWDSLAEGKVDRRSPL
jgi:hypothetical protein